MSGKIDSDIEKVNDELEPSDKTALEEANTERHLLVKRLISWGVEARGIQPVSIEDRTDSQFRKIFFIWFSCNMNLLTIAPGTLGPTSFGLNLRDTCLIILFVNLLCCALPAYLSTWGPKTGMRQMIVSRYSFGYYGVIIPCLFNLIVLFGFSILNAIIGGQALSSVSDRNLSYSIGIVIIIVVSLLTSFCGYSVVNWYEKVAWIPVLFAFVIEAGVAGRHLRILPMESSATAKDVFTFISTLAGFILTFASLSSDFATYFRPDVSSRRIFLYSYAGFLIPMVSLECLGAALAAAVSSNPEWEEGFSGGNVGGLLEATLHPVKGFGKFLTVLISFSATGNLVANFYSITLSLQVFIPFLVVVPRYLFSIVATAIVIPISIVGAHRFYETLLNFLSFVSYWAGAFAAIILVEHLVFRRGDFATYRLEIWNVPRRLPSGVPAVVAGLSSFGLVVPCMNTAWYTGPIAETTGDIGFEVAFAVGGLLYLPLRALEIRLRKSL